MKSVSSSWSWWQQHISKKLGQGHVSHCAACRLLLTTVCKHLGTEETSCWTVGREMLPHSHLIYISICSTALGLLCHIQRFKMRQIFSTQERSGLQAGQSSTQTLPLRSHAVAAQTQYVVQHWRVEIFMAWKRHLDGAYVALKPVCTLLHPWCLSRCADNQFIDTNAPPHHRRCRLLNWELITNSMVSWAAFVNDTLFTDNDFQKCSWAHAVISITGSCLFLMQSCLKAQRSQIFSHVLCTQRWLQTLWMFWWYYVQLIMKYSKSLQFYNEEL